MLTVNDLGTNSWTILLTLEHVCHAGLSYFSFKTKYFNQNSLCSSILLHFSFCSHVSKQRFHIILKIWIESRTSDVRTQFYFNLITNYVWCRKNVKSIWNNQYSCDLQKNKKFHTLQKLQPFPLFLPVLLWLDHTRLKTHLNERVCNICQKDTFHILLHSFTKYSETKFNCV